MWLCSQINVIWQLLQRDLKYWGVVSVFSFFLSLYCQHNRGLMDGPLASISENRIASGVRIKHGKGQNKTKQNKHKQTNKNLKVKEETGTKSMTMKWHNKPELPPYSLFTRERNLCFFLISILYIFKDLFSILIFCYLESNLILTNPGC